MQSRISGDPDSVGHIFGQAASLADRLSAASDELIEAFGRGLVASTTVFASSELAREQAQAQMRLIIDDVVNALRGQPTVEPDGLGLSREIGLDRAREQIHPLDSLAAARVLSRIVVEWGLSQRVEDDDLSGHQLSVFLAELNASLVYRITIATTWYASYLLHQVMYAHRDERRRVARDLHDQVSYGVMRAKLGLESFYALQGQRDTDAADVIEQARDRLDTTLTTISGLIGDLRAEVADLSLSLKALTEGLAEDGVSITFEAHGDEVWMPASARTEVFLIVQEAVRNAVRHADAQAISVVVEVMPFLLTALVDDDGRGPGDAEVMVETGGHGIVGMTERAVVLGGSLTVSNRPDGGTRVCLRVPLAQDS